MTRPIGETTVRGDFSPGTRLEAHGRRYRMSVRDGRRYIAVSHGGRPFEEFEAQYTLGELRVQGYLSTLPDGRMYVLPRSGRSASGGGSTGRRPRRSPTAPTT